MQQNLIWKKQQINADMLKLVPIDLKRLRDVVEKWSCEKGSIMNWLKTLMSLLLINVLKTDYDNKIVILKVKYQILLA